LVRPILSSDCLMVCHRRANGCTRCRGTLSHYSISQCSLKVSSILGTMRFKLFYRAHNSHSFKQNSNINQLPSGRGINFAYVILIVKK
jgi:hypothetical protein